MNNDMQSVTPVAATPTFWQKHGQKLAALTFWLILIGAVVAYASSNNLTPLQAVQQLVDALRSPFGGLLYILLYTLRPLIFFPATLLTIAGGSIFGVWWGIILTVIGSNLSATVAYGLGRWFGGDLFQADPNSTASGFVATWAERMRANAFDTVLIMRFLFLPYDLVNYLAGFLRIGYPGFILATIIGSLPGTVSIVLFGASIQIERLEEGVSPSLDPLTFGISVVLFVGSLAFSRWLKQRETAKRAG
ncbi:MAG: TVP38/TMEM64 family protein [Chloroflexaceae bacterium]|nr:TVP38/TMEM64 family protein [Chloroflexaceae bacterium]